MTRLGPAGAETGDPPTLESDADYRGALGRLSRNSEAPVVLRILMRALESYREARKLGWSRPWNKHGVRTFQAFRLRPDEDRDLLRHGVEVVGRYGCDMPSAAMAFVHDLTGNPDRLMGFVFVQEVEDAGERWEAVTLSLGRKAQTSARYRDRLDLILECRIDVISPPQPYRLRVFVDPFEGRRSSAWSSAYAVSRGDCAFELFQRFAALASSWSEDESRVWSHWSMRYIDYFGPRRWASEASHFPWPESPRAGGTDRGSQGHL